MGKHAFLVVEVDTSFLDVAFALGRASSMGGVGCLVVALLVLDMEVCTAASCGTEDEAGSRKGKEDRAFECVLRVSISYSCLLCSWSQLLCFELDFATQAQIHRCFLAHEESRAA